MPVRVRTCRTAEEYKGAAACIFHYVGQTPDDTMVERWQKVLPFEYMHAALDGRSVVGGAGAFPFRMTVPGGGPVDCAGVTVVGVLPTHRRQGVLTRLMRAQLADERERGRPFAALYASEEPIYGRFGYGLSFLNGDIAIPRAHGRFMRTFEARGTYRLVSLDEAYALCAPVYRRVARRTPGMVDRSRAWWEGRQLRDDPDQRNGWGVKNVAVYEVDGTPAAYAIYRLKSDWEESMPSGKLFVSEAQGVSLEATAAIWRFLIDYDWTATVEAECMPPDHPLFHLLAYPRRMRYRMGDGVWLRPLDVGAMLSARRYGQDGRLTLEVTSDPLFPDNVGTWTIADGAAKRSRRRPDIRLDVQALGQVYLNGFSFAALERGGRLEEAVRGGLRRADALFATGDPYPWCPEIF
jgi:predicted acetyltransferase